MWTPGVLMEVIATSISASSMYDRVDSFDQGAGKMPPTGLCASFVARQKTSGRMWW